MSPMQVRDVQKGETFSGLVVDFNVTRQFVIKGDGLRPPEGVSGKSMAHDYYSRVKSQLPFLKELHYYVTDINHLGNKTLPDESEVGMFEVTYQFEIELVFPSFLSSTVGWSLDMIAHLLDDLS